MNASVAWHAAIAAYLIAQQAGGAPSTTVYTRRQHLEHLARRIGAELVDVTGAVLVDWAGRQSWARETRRGRRTTFRSFWSWALEQQLTAHDAAAALPRVKPGEPRPRPTPDRVFTAALRRGDERERLILRLAAECGLRRAEIAVVHRRDLVEDLLGWSLIVHGKGGKERLVPLPPWIAQHVAAADGWVFPGDVDGHLSPRWVGRLIGRLLGDGWTIHTLRHRAGTRWYAVDRDVFTVQELLGHASPATTRVYVAVPRESLRRTVLAAAS